MARSRHRRALRRSRHRRALVREQALGLGSKPSPHKTTNKPRGYQGALG